MAATVSELHLLITMWFDSKWPCGDTHLVRGPGWLACDFACQSTYKRSSHRVFWKCLQVCDEVLNAWLTLQASGNFNVSSCIWRILEICISIRWTSAFVMWRSWYLGKVWRVFLLYIAMALCVSSDIVILTAYRIISVLRYCLLNWALTKLILHTLLQSGMCM